MEYFKNVRGTQLTVPTIELGASTVYIRDNIKQIKDEEGNDCWEYNEKQLSLEEYFRQIIPQSEDAIGEISQMFALYQAQTDEAIAELSILIGGANNV